MDLNPSNFYNYFKECYRLDYKEFTIDNVLSSKYPYKWFATGTEELVAQQLPLIPYPNKKANDLAKEIALYDLEKKLFYGCFFLLGSSNNPLIKDKRICAPLLLFPATLKEIDDDYYISVDFNACDVNRSALSLLEVREELIQKDAFAQQLLEKFVATQNYIGLSGFLEKYVSNVTTEELLLFPTVWNAQKIRNEFKTAPLSEDEFKIIPAAGTVLVEKAASSLQVLNDLTELSEQGTFSTAMQQLLTSEVAIPKPYESYYQSRLNTDQYQALINAHAYENSVIVGPPGTGKTYTITSIISDAVVQNESVLVVSKTKQAVEVLRHMLQTDFKLKDYLIHTSGARYKMSLTAKINRYLSGIQNRKQSSFNAFKIEYLSKQLEKLEAEFEACVQEEIELSDLEFNADLNLLEKWKKFYLKRIVYNGTKIWSVFEKMNTVLLQLEEEISKHTQQKIADNIHRNSHTYRKDISLFHDALTSSSFSEYKRILETVIQKNVLKVFPIWLANLAELNAVLPLEKEMFDLVIIDEATQCDIASALPALYRAKRVVIAGDPNQLRHYSFVSKAQQFNLQKQYQLPEDKIFDYRNRSVLDLFISKVATQAQVTFLREHFRSTPSLIAFSNKQFYDGQLEILKATPEHIQASQLTHILVEGERSKKGINEIEAQAVLEQLQTLIDAYANVSKKPSIGIISPFNSQVVYLKQRLQATFETSVLKRFDILCGTPYQFQGSEREIILLSFCVSKHTHHSAFNHINKPEVLNVAVTRAKSLQYIFTSVQKKDLTPDSLLERYLRFVTNFSHTEKQQPELDDFQQEVIQSLSKYKLDAIHCGYPVAGSLLDILIVHNEQNYFIDLIGYPGIYKEAFTLERYKTLGRTGITTIPLHYSFWQKNKPEAIQKIVAFIK